MIGKTINLIAIFGMSLGTMACGSSDTKSIDKASMPEETVTELVADSISTAKVLCTFSESGEQRLVYIHRGGPNKVETPIDETLPYNFTSSGPGRRGGPGSPDGAVVLVALVVHLDSSSSGPETFF